MAGLYHFIPNFRGISPDGFATAGLGEVLRDVETLPDHAVSCVCEHGPAGGPGVVIYAKDANDGDAKLPRVLAYDATQQTWRKSQDGTRWIGWLNHSPPTEADLRRRDMSPGYLINECWHVPIARQSKDDPTGTLPCSYRFDAAHKPVATVEEAHRKLWSDSGLVWDFFNEDAEAAPFPIPDDRLEAWQIGVAMSALAVNYRVGPEEANVLSELGVLSITPKFALQTLFALVDFNRLQEFKKKGAEASSQQTEGQSICSPGDGADSTPSTRAGVS